jgi:hypothetical protein
MAHLKDVWVILDNTKGPEKSYEEYGKSFRIVLNIDADDCVRGNINAIMLSGISTVDHKLLFNKLIVFNYLNMGGKLGGSIMMSEVSEHVKHTCHHRAIYLLECIKKHSSIKSMLYSHAIQLKNEAIQNTKLKNEPIQNTKLEQDIISQHSLSKKVNEANVVLRKDLEEASAKNTKLEQEIILLRKEFDDAKQTSLTFMNCLQSRINALESIPVAIPVAVIKTVGEELLYDS